MAPEALPSRKHPREAAADCDRRRTRTKLSPPTDSTSKSPVNPSDSVDVSSKNGFAHVDDSDTSSALSESSSEPSSESSDDSSSEDGSTLSDEENNDGVVNLRVNRGKKPRMKIRKNDIGPDIRPFLKDFLPKLKAANDELEAERKAGTLSKREIDREDGVDNQDGADKDPGQYVEMDLGLGVLEEKKSDASDDSESDDEAKVEGDPTAQPKEKDVMGKLMGQDRKGAGIQVVDDAQET